MNTEQINTTPQVAEQPVVEVAPTPAPAVVEPQEYAFNAPQEGDTAGWSKVYDGMGRPETAEKYEYAINDQLAEHLPPELLSGYNDIFHKIGLSQGGANELLEYHQKGLMEHITANEAEQARLGALSPEDYLAHVYPDEKERQSVGEGIAKAEEALGEDFFNDLVGNPAFDTPDAHRLLAKVGEALANKISTVATGSNELAGVTPDLDAMMKGATSADLYNPVTPVGAEYNRRQIEEETRRMQQEKGW